MKLKMKIIQNYLSLDKALITLQNMSNNGDIL